MKIIALICLIILTFFTFECAYSLHQIAPYHTGLCFIKFATWRRVAKGTVSGIKSIVETTKE